MSKLFERTEINGMKLANRFVRSATWEGMAAEDGACTTKLIELVVQLAQGGGGPDHHQPCLRPAGRSGRALATRSL